MKPYVEWEHLVAPEEVSVFRAVEWVVSAIPDDFPTKEQPLRCHELARAVHDWVEKQPPLRWGPRKVSLGVVDGKHGSVEHTWLDTGFGENILDPYVPGELPMVQLRHGSKFLPGAYVPGRLRGDIREDVIEQLIAIFAAADDEKMSVAPQPPLPPL